MGSCASECPWQASGPRLPGTPLSHNRLAELFRQGLQRGLQGRSEPLLQSSQQDGPGLAREDEDSEAGQPRLPSPASAVTQPLSPTGMLWNTLMPGPLRVSHVLLCYFRPHHHHHQRSQDALCRKHSPWFASCLAHKGQPELTSVLEAVKSWRGISGMQVEEGLRNPAFSHSAGADGPTTHQAVPTLLWPEWGPIPRCACAPSAPRGASKTTPSGMFKSKALGLLSGRVQCVC